MTDSYLQSPQKSYEEQRKDRMQDAIDDYLQDDKVSSRQTYEEILSCVDDVIKYHEQSYVRARELRDLLSGYGSPEYYKQIPNRY